MSERWQRQLGRLQTLEPAHDVWERATAGPARPLPPPPRSPWLTIVGVLLALSLVSYGLLRAFGPLAGSRLRPAESCTVQHLDVSAPVTPSHLGLASVAVIAPDDAWAVGPSRFYEPGTGVLVVHWDGVGWRRVETAPPPAGAVGAELVGVAAAASDDVWAVGNTFFRGLDGRYVTTGWIQRWDGASWSAVPTPSDAGPNHVLSAVAAVSRTDAWAVGYTLPPDGVSRPLIEHWDGRTWSVTAGPRVELGATLRTLAVAGPRDVWAAGTSHGGALMEHWDGHAWRVVALPSSTDPNPRRALVELTSLAALGPHDVWAAGTFSGSKPIPGSTRSEPSRNDTWSSLPSRPVLLHWDGSEWREPATPPRGPADVILLYALSAMGPSDIWAAGYRHLVGKDRDVAFAMHWDGAGWTDTPLVGTGSRPNARLWAAAPFTGGRTLFVGESSAKPKPYPGRTEPFMVAAGCRP